MPVPVKPLPQKVSSPTEAPKLAQLEIKEALKPDEAISDSFDATLYRRLEVKANAKRHTAQIRVEVDETLGHYSEWLGIPTYRIRRLNRMGKRSIRINQKITIPLDVNKIESFKTKRLEYHMYLEEDFYEEYLVVDVKERKTRYGENLWSICNDEEIPFWLLKKYNRDAKLYRLKLGGKLKLPVVRKK